MHRYAFDNAIMHAFDNAASRYAHWFWGFFTNKWCWFDLIVVAFSLSDTVYVLTGVTNNSGLNVVRLLRIFRIVRIIHTLEHMRRTLTALLSTIGLIINAFLLFIVIIAIYAVLGVNLFKPQAAQDPQHAFRSFSISCYSLLGIAYGSSNWTEMLLQSGDESDFSFWVCAYFLTFVALVGIIAFNIIVAVMLQVLPRLRSSTL